ncbi:Uncharacterised protein [Legionella beliardensis]|uniref:Transmembrane protein n=1 Tax=Legionella beliardensis TaxID=91822 RepID=A0A378I1H1_9GAMM|nr:hypothetical protein [Legionella beliardensis]STX28570.1 Uncharacterised protein [Legionella beliardensis]
MKEVRTTELPRKNHHFMLKCMAALTGVAVASTVALLAFSAKSTALAASTTLMAAAAVAPAAAPLFLPILPIAAVMLTIGGVCLLPFLFGNSCRNPGYRPYATAYATTPSYQPTFYGRPRAVYTNGVAPAPYVGHHHNHPNAYSGHHHHGHGNGIPQVETHSGSNYHSHR